MRTNDDDDALIAAVRNGDVDAFGLLYARHHASVRRFAQYMVRSVGLAEDLVTEAFTRVLHAIRTGGGPTSAFRVYVLATARHLAHDVDEKAAAGRNPGEPGGDSPTRAPRSATRAFQSLPERWQTVLWHSLVEGEPPAEVAPFLGLSTEAVAALAYRAREGFKAAYLQIHLGDHPVEDPCRTMAGRLGSFSRGRLNTRDAKVVRSHVAGCEYCRRLSTALDGVDENIAGILMTAVLGTACAGARTPTSSTC